MPLLHKKTFEPVEFPVDLRGSEEVFFCQTTGEIFRDYDDYCERIILCNSLVWSCSLTGRSNLTYSEAKASEDKIKKLLKQFPMELRIPVLYLASICERRSLVDLAEEVYNYVKDRFFIGETVQINVSGKGNVDGHVLSVIPPTKEELASLSRKTLNSDKHYPPASSYKYEIERHDNGEEIEATHDQISRPKLVYNKDKNRLYIKQFVHLVNGVWKLKDSSNAKYGINKIKFDQIFCGNPPDMNPKQEAKKKTAEKSKKQETINKYFKQTEKSYNISPKSNNRRKSEPIPNSKKVVRRRKPKSDKQSSEEEKKKLDRKENSKKYAEFVKEWSMKREDLECEDLKDMPGTTPVEGKIPNERFGSVIMILEFLQSFNSVLALKDFFPHGVTLDLLERALLEKEVAGPLCDIIQMLLSAIFDLRDQEEEVKEDTKINPADKFTKNGTESKILTMAKTSEYWIKRNHGVYLTQLTLDSSTLSEVLRLHLLSSGANPKTSKIAKWRYQARGGYLNHDDPAVTLKMAEPELIVKLADTNVNNLELEERLLIVECLINQILTYVGPREIIEEGCEQGKQARTEIRTLNAKQARLDKAEALKQKELKKEGGANSTKEKDEDGKVKDLRSSEKETEVEALQRKVRETLGKVQLQPLGTDRAHRRFWVFPSFPGLFVEDDDSYKGECLPKRTPSVPFTNLDGDDIKYLKKLFEESGNKENFAGKQKTINFSSPSKKLLAEKNGSDSPVKSDVQKVELNKPLTCWADPVNCPVHGHASKRVAWSFYKDQSEIENLINSLNQRGVRERKLRQVLLQEKEKIIKSLKNCPFQKLNPSLVSEENLVETRNKHVSNINKLYKNANLSYPPGTPLDEIQEKDLRHYLLELENKITAGALGTLKVKDLELWRDAILNGSYDKQCKKLTWGKGNGNNGNESDSEIEMEENENDEEKIDVENEDNDVIKEDEEEEGGSRSSTPSLEVSFEAPEKQGVIETVPQKPVILDLASAILQVAQSLDPSFLKRPLGFDPKERDRYDGTHSSSTMLRWERSLMKSTSFAQLYLRLATLEASIIWEKSAMKVYCRVCRSKEDPEQTLLCDTCNKGFHFYCLKPKLTKVPVGEWHCPRCKPKEKGAKRKRKNEESDEEDLEDCFCKVCNEKGAQIKCDECKSKLHLACVNPPLRKIPQSDWLWICHLCRLQNSQLAAEKKGLNDSKGEPAVKKEIKTEAKEPKPRIKREKVEEKIQTVKKNGLTNHDDYMCEWRDSDRLSPDLERSSRRRSSKAATAKISHFAKQLRSTHWDEDGVVDETTEPLRPGRRSRRTVEVPKKTRDLPLDNAALQEILETLMHQDEAWPFLRPVTKVEVPDYHSIIKKPMDFGTIKHKLNMLQYTKNSELIADANLLFDNCFLYNQEGSEVYKAGEELQELFYKLCEEHNLLKDLEPPLKKARTVLDL